MFIKRFNEFRIATPSRAIARFHASEPHEIAGYLQTFIAEFRMEQTMKAFRIFAICLAAVLALPCLARAQDTGYITGTVTDKSSAAVAGAQVTVANEARGIHQTVPTNSTGDYLVAGLPAATYS